MTKDELYSNMSAMLPVENTDCKPFRILLSDSLKTYLSYTLIPQHYNLIFFIST